MSDRSRVLITGGSGLIGGLVIKHLSDKYEFSNLSRRAVEGIRSTAASIGDLEAIRPAFDGIDMVLHLAAFTEDSADWDGQLDITVKGTVNVFRATQEAGVWRVVNMSTGSTMCGWEWYEGSPYGALARGEYESVEKPWPTIDYADAVRPDSPYGAAKVFTEAAGRWFSDAHGMSMLNIRLGVVLDTNAPKRRRHFPGFLDQMDAVRMIDACLSAPETVKFDIFDAISDNSTRWRDTSHAEDVIGWKAEGSSDRFEPNDYRDQPGPALPTG